MKLNPREKVMLSLLGIVAVLAFSYYIIIRPPLDKIDTLRAEENTVKSQIREIERELTTGANLEEQIEELSTKIEEMTEMFYPVILTEKTIVIFDKIVEDTGIKNTTTNYGKSSVSEVKVISQKADAVNYHLKELEQKYRAIYPLPVELDTESQPDSIPAGTAIPPEMKKLEAASVTLQLQGTYEQMVTFIDSVEKLGKTVMIASLTAGKSEEELNISMEIVMYALPKLYPQDDEYFTWPYNGLYGKENPF